MNPKVSIITASLNSESTISDCIYSVLNQSYKNIEYLIIDGGSTDKTIEIIKNLEPLFFGRLKWISENDKGIYDAWNKGIKLSSGDWISFVGSDDILIESAVSEYIKTIENNPSINFISSKILHVTKNLNPIRLIGKPWNKKMRSYCCIAHTGSLHNKNLFYQKGLFNSDFKIAGDYDFLLRCTDVINPCFMPEVTAMVREGGISDKLIFRVARETLSAKINNKSRPVLVCYIEYCLMILKFFIRTKLLKISLVSDLNNKRGLLPIALFIKASML